MMAKRILQLLEVLFLAYFSCVYGASIDTSTCGVSKGCIRDPGQPDCVGDACDILLTWTPPAAGETTILFELQGKSDGWVAVGFSNDKTMGDDSVAECLQTSSGVLVRTSYNEASKGQFDDLGQEGISATSGEYVSGLVRCSFKRNVASSNSKVYALDTAYTVFIARGPVSGNSKSYHNTPPLVSGDPIDMTKDLTGGVSVEKSPLVRAHGVLMLTAWTIMMSTSLILARFYKEAWPGKLLCDKKPIWFSVHRGLNILVLVLTIIAFIIIFSEVQAWTTGTDAFSRGHPIMGIIVTILVIVNPLMALCRPGPTAERRYIFNWAHWGVGTAAHTLAIPTIFFGMELQKAQTFIREWVKWVLIAFACVYAITVITLEIHKCVMRKSAGQEMEMQQVGEDTPKRAPPGMMFRYAVFAFYLVIALALYLTIVIAMIAG